VVSIGFGGETAFVVGPVFVDFETADGGGITFGSGPEFAAFFPLSE
jgi:hypothetical protein